MPKISDARKAERREQILAGAARCFAEHGYEGATVAKLEREIGLSRGAIFNYFASKEDLFLELAARDTKRVSEVFLDRGLEGVLHEILEFDPSWLSVYLELVRRARTDPAFRTRLESRETEFVLANRARVEEAQRAGEIRDDLDPKSLGIFVNLVLHGLMVQRATGEDPPPVGLVLGLLEDAIGGARRRTPSRTPA
ncbi:MAG: TetR/AcrR family transcriptional regulator [Gaiellaceae bacterium]|nr:TetR/AcrR family transcriptional regulator [Gaiellaceae bacterium]